MRMNKVKFKSARGIGLNDNVSLAILGATMRIQCKWLACMMPLQACVPVTSNTMMGYCQS